MLSALLMLSPVRTSVTRTCISQTRKLCYRKDNRAMRPIYRCPENFLDQDSLTTSTVIFPLIFHGLLFRLTLWLCVPNLKSVALPVPEIIGDWSFGWGLRSSNVGKGARRGSGMIPSERALVSSYRSSIHSSLFLLPEILDCCFEWGCEPQSWGRGP